MSYPLILPFEEQDERYKFANFLWRIFSMGKASSTQFESSLSAEALLNIYKVYRPNTTLTVDMISHMMMYGGYMNAYGEVYFRINPETFKELPTATQEKILSYCNYAKSLSLRQIMLGNDTTAVDRGVALNESFRHFVQTQVFDKKFKFWNAIPKGLRKTGVTELYNYYSEWCLNFCYKPETKRNFLQLFRNLNYKVGPGYYKGVSGVNIVNGIVIPTSEEEKAMTLKLKGIGVIYLQGRYIFNDSTLMSDYTEDGLKAYIESRRCVSSAQSRTEKKGQEKEEIQQTHINGGRTEISTNSISGRTQEIFAQEERRANRSDYEESQPGSQTDSRTSGRDTEGKPTAITGAQCKSASDRIKELGAKSVATSADKPQANNKGSGESFSGNNRSIEAAVDLPLTGAAKKAFYTSLRITVRLAAPGSFNFSTFCDEIEKANLGVMTDQQKHLLYDDFMKTIKK